MSKKPADYLAMLAAELPPPEPLRNRPLVLDLFAGCGGLALGFEAAGFQTIGFEMLGPACNTYGKNLRAECRQTVLLPDTEYPAGVEVIIGGPPCQPFSVNGHQNGCRDERDGFPAFLSAVERLRPRLAVFENVRGMMYQNRAYFDSIIAALRRLDYEVDWTLLNAVDYGVPQNRQRLFVAAHKGGWEFPEPTHSGQHVSAGQALPLALEAPPDSRFLTPSMDD